jgi:hypothetical protein
MIRANLITQNCCLPQASASTTLTLLTVNILVRLLRLVLKATNLTQMENKTKLRISLNIEALTLSVGSDHNWWVQKRRSSLRS